MTLLAHRAQIPVALLLFLGAACRADDGELPDDGQAAEAGADLVVRNHRSYESGFCDGYWNWAFTILGQ